MFHKATGEDPLEPRRQGRRRVPPRDRSAGGRRQARRAARAVPRQLQERAGRARIPGMAARAVQGLQRRRGAAASQLERRPASRRSRCSRRSARRGRRSTSRSSSCSIRQDFAPNVRSFYYLRLHGRNAAQWWKHEKSEDRYNYLYSAEELEPFAEAADEASRGGEEGVSLREQSLLGEVGGQRRDPQAPARTAAPGEYPEEFVERYPDLKGLVKILRRRSFLHGSLLEHVGLLNLRRDVEPFDHLAEDGVLAVERRRRAQRDVELAVGVLRRCRCAPCRPRPDRVGASS